MVRVGLTGIYGSSKSAALREFSKEGAFTLSADRIVAELLEEPAVISRVREAVGPLAVTASGAVDKRSIAKAIFGDAKKRAAIEAVLHPMVAERIERALASAHARVAVVELPLLFEAAMEGRFDRTVAIVSGEELAVSRLKEAGLSGRDARARLRAQWPEIEKVRRADHVIINRSGPEALSAAVRNLMPRLTKAAPSRSSTLCEKW